MRTSVATVAVVMTVCLVASAHAGSDPAAVCTATKTKAAGKKTFDLLRAFGKNRKNPSQARLDANISKARSKFTKAFSKAETGTCLTTGDVGAIEAKVDVFVAEVDAELTRFVDNGDGTITDRLTGLMWEKKDDNNAGGIHDKDNRYSWAGCCGGSCSVSTLCQPNAAAAAACSTQTGGAVGCSECSVGTCDVGAYNPAAITTIWDWLVQLNAEGGSGFAGYSDWRIPSEDGCNSCRVDFACPCTPNELETILLTPYPCGTAPCVDPVFFNTGCTGGCTVTTCSCTVEPLHWSSTTGLNDTRAWGVIFADGRVLGAYKGDASYARAVRGPLVSSPSRAFLEMTGTLLD